MKDESVTDTLLDLANYCILMAGYVESVRQAKPPVFNPVTEYPLQSRFYKDDEREYASDRTICLTQQDMADIKESWIAP